MAMRLLPLLQIKAQSRIVITASDVHNPGPAVVALVNRQGSETWTD